MGPPPLGAGLEPLFTDAGLRPLLAVCVLVLATFGSALVVLAVGDRNLAAMGALALLAGLTLYALDEARRRGPGSRLPRLLGALWILSLVGGLAYARWLPG